MRKTISSQALDSLTTKDKARPSRRKRAVKSAVMQPTIFDRLAQTLQPALDEVDAAWTL